jgi:hypothetical protein
MECLSFSVWMVLLNVIISHSMHFLVNDIVSFFIMAEQYCVCIHTTFSLPIHELMNHLH